MLSGCGGLALHVLQIVQKLAKDRITQIQQGNIVSAETWKTLPVAVGGQGKQRDYVWAIDSKLLLIVC